MVTTIQIDNSLKEKLEMMKIHHRESFNDLLVRLISSLAESKKNEESVKETLEIITDPETMRAIANGLEDFDKGNFKNLDKLKKELS